MRCPLILLLFAGPALAADPAGLRFFEQKVRPVLVEHCYSCHSAEAKKSRGGLRVDTREALLKGGDAGPAVVPGKPLASLLIKAIRHDGISMPPKEKLPARIIADLEAWVRMGAPDPRTGKAVVGAGGIDIAKGRAFWSFQPPRRHAAPDVKDAEWARGGIDRFLLAALEKQGLRPVADAEPAVWLRRVTFALTGLPPSPEEIEAFLGDPSPSARERLVDRLLGSSAFGERWGRHWLDLARYADSNGKDENLTFHEAHVYRDWVIRAVNDDMPYDRFVKEQIAGDLLGGEGPLAASGFLVIGPKVLADRDQTRRRLDVIDEQVDTVGRVFLGLSLGCARCHDHKFDPVPTADYYALAGIFSSTRTLDGFKLGNPVVSGWSVRPVDAANEKLLAAKTAHDAKLKAIATRLTKAKADLKASEDKGTMRVASRLPGIVVDDADAKLVGGWKASTFSRPYVGKGYIHDDRAGKGEKSATFTPKLPKAGTYEVFVSYTPAATRATNVPVTIRHADGEKTVEIDQRKKPALDGLFASVGVYRFEAGTLGAVVITNKGTEGHVIVDAARFIPKGALEKDAEMAMGVPAGVKEAIAATKKAIATLEEEEAALKKAAPPAPRLVMAPRDEAAPADLRIHVRGSHETLGASVPRGFLQVASWSERPAIPAGQSGRLQLAEWLADPRNPLTARVIVNRVWKHLFGEGIVRSVDDFGIQGTRPTHPELLDTLALDLMEGGWRLKPLIRRLVLSRAFGLAVGADGKAAAADPENKLLWRANRRRLEAEAIRDGILTVSGRLKRAMGGSAVSMLPERAITNESKGGIATERDERRAVYLPVIRNGLPGLFEVFDFADPDVATGRREATTVPTQALFLLNSPFAIEQARHAASRLLAMPGDEARVRHLYRLSLGRPPAGAEVSRALAFVREYGPDEREAWAALCQAMFGCTEFRFLE